MKNKNPDWYELGFRNLKEFEVFLAGVLIARTEDPKAPKSLYMSFPEYNFVFPEQDTKEVKQ